MPIAVKLELLFDTADEVLDLMEHIISPQFPDDAAQARPQSSYEARIARTEAQAQPLMDMLTNALAEKGMQPVRLQDAQAVDDSG